MPVMLTSEEWQAVVLSLQAAGLAVLFSLPAAVAAGYLLARWQSRARAFVETVVNLPLVLPPVVTGFLLLILFGRQGPLGSLLEETLGIRVAFTWLGAVTAAAVVGFPLMVRAIRLAFQSVDVELESAARSLGAGPCDVFFSVSLPLAFRGVVAGSVLAFARGLGEFGATILLAGNIEGETRTIPLAIYSLVNRPGGMAECWRLVAISIAISGLAIVISEVLERRERRRD